MYIYIYQISNWILDSSQYSFKDVLSTYYYRCTGAIIVYDIQSRESFEEAMDWVVELREKVCFRNSIVSEWIKSILSIYILKTSTGMVIVLAGNKADMEANRVITKNEAEEFAALHNLIFMETSCVSGMNVHNCFVELGMIMCGHTYMDIDTFIFTANVIQSEVDEKDSRTKKVKGSSHGKWSCWCITGSSPELNKTK